VFFSTRYGCTDHPDQKFHPVEKVFTAVGDMKKAGVNRPFSESGSLSLKACRAKVGSGFAITTCGKTKT
jgi:hypothetical protein